MAFNLIRVLRTLAAPVAGSELAASQGISHPTLWRAMRAAGPQIASWKEGRRLWLAATRPPGLIPVRRVASDGEIIDLPPARPLANGGTLWIDWRGHLRVFEGLPPEIAALRPEGFLGRALARQIATTYDVADNPSHWSDDEVLRIMSERGEDLPGDLILGEASLARWYQNSARPIPETDGLAEAFEARARATLAGDLPGSSAGGEQPKFTAILQTTDGALCSVLVKFAPRGSAPIACRLSDLLAAEAIALAVLQKAGLPAVVPRIIDGPDRRFLVSPRYDRVAATGRRGVLPLGALDDEYFGKRRTSWTAASARLVAARMLPPQDAAHLRQADAFGALMVNTDRHYGNVSLWRPTSSGDTFRLAPLYDMAPMAYAPVGGELRAQVAKTPITLPGLSGAERALVKEWALTFWAECTKSPLISPAFQAIATAHIAQLSESPEV